MDKARKENIRYRKAIKMAKEELYYASVSNARVILEKVLEGEST